MLSGLSFQTFRLFRSCLLAIPVFSLELPDSRSLRNIEILQVVLASGLALAGGFSAAFYGVPGSSSFFMGLDVLLVTVIETLFQVLDCRTEHSALVQGVD